MGNQIYPPPLQLNKANTSDTGAPFLDLHLSISDGFVPPKIMIIAMTLILILYMFPFWIAMCNVVPLMECIFLNKFHNIC